MAVPWFDNWFRGPWFRGWSVLLSPVGISGLTSGDFALIDAGEGVVVVRIKKVTTKEVLVTACEDRPVSVEPALVLARIINGSESHADP